MRLVGHDIVLLLVGLSLFAGSSFAFYNLQGAGAIGQQTSAQGLFNVTYEKKSENVGDKPVASFGSGTQDFDVTRGNVSQIDVTIKCTPSQAQVSFNIQVTVTGPGVSKQEAKACGQTFKIEVPVTAMPQGGAVKGSTEQEARSNLPYDKTNATKAEGKWSVKYSGSYQGVPTMITQIPPPGGSIQLDAQVWSYKLTAVNNR